MNQTVKVDLSTQGAVSKVAAKPPPRFRIVPAPIREAIRPGRVMIREGIPLPMSLQVEQRRAGDWSLVLSGDATALSRKLIEAGWNFFFLAPAIDSAAVALNPHRALVKALKRVVQEVERKGFNAVEIADVQTRRRLGLWSAKIKAHPRHIRKSPYIKELDPYHYPAGIWDFTRIFTARNRRAPQIKAM